MELNLRFLQFFLFQSLKSYVEIVGRAVYLKTPEKQDELESKVIFSGILEDATFKMPFVSHKLNIPWQRDTVYKFDNAYVHEFPDRSLLLVITEFTEWQLKVVWRRIWSTSNKSTLE